jgi:hypothetical protein
VCRSLRTALDTSSALPHHPRMHLRFPHAVIALSLLAVLGLAPRAAADSLPDFLRRLVDENLEVHAAVRDGEYARFCGDLGLDPAARENRRPFATLFFLHDLLTNDGVRNGSRGGILREPYFWHWVEDNPRHGIVRLATGRPLTEESPPELFGRYQSFADVDRVPSLFLRDLVSVEPLYTHPACGEFRTFGWCSEKEMAFCLVTGLLGLPGVIVQEGNHVRSVYLVRGVRADGGRRHVVIEVDNTYDLVTWRPLRADEAPAGWLDRIPDVGMSRWYNEQARDPAEIRRVREIEVAPAAAARIHRLVTDWLARH